jgi:hypothetical protein
MLPGPIPSRCAARPWAFTSTPAIIAFTVLIGRASDAAARISMAAQFVVHPGVGATID